MACVITLFIDKITCDCYFDNVPRQAWGKWYFVVEMVVACACLKQVAFQKKYLTGVRTKTDQKFVRIVNENKLYNEFKKNYRKCGKHLCQSGIKTLNTSCNYKEHTELTKTSLSKRKKRNGVSYIEGSFLDHNTIVRGLGVINSHSTTMGDCHVSKASNRMGSHGTHHWVLKSIPNRQEFKNKKKNKRKAVSGPLLTSKPSCNASSFSHWRWSATKQIPLFLRREVRPQRLLGEVELPTAGAAWPVVDMA